MSGGWAKALGLPVLAHLKVYTNACVGGDRPRFGDPSLSGQGRLLAA